MKIVDKKFKSFFKASEAHADDDECSRARGECERETIMLKGAIFAVLLSIKFLSPGACS
jgi:hypothetical protein